ncbi:hypothetical protein Ciccas_013901 [Cichlidogyrus casuarinus]|uniref:Uncharacterized protein n=1 Tax=Cichlidogyrus casuarinus TaxID=1844966 RepID=A0ABD2PL55_9PLAT
MDKSSSEDEQFMQWLISDVSENRLLFPAAVDAVKYRRRKEKLLRNPQRNFGSSNSEENTTDESNANITLREDAYESFCDNSISQRIVRVDQLLANIENKTVSSNLRALLITFCKQRKIRFVDQQIESNLLHAEEILGFLKSRPAKPKMAIPLSVVSL